MTPATPAATRPVTAWIEYKPGPTSQSVRFGDRASKPAAARRQPKPIESHFGRINRYVGSYTETYF